jgi:hypothetical protein
MLERLADRSRRRHTHPPSFNRLLFLFETEHEQVVVSRKPAGLGIRLDFHFARSLYKIVFVQDNASWNFIVVRSSTSVLDCHVLDHVRFGSSLRYREDCTSSGACVDRHLQGFSGLELDGFRAMSSAPERHK